MKARLLVVSLVIFAVFLTFALAVAASGGTYNWVKVNPSGFGQAGNDSVAALASFGGRLYAGVSNYTTGAQLWRKAGNLGWTAVMTNGFGTVNNGNIDHLFVFNGQLYAGTENEANGGEVWRSAGGAWTPVVTNGFGDPTNAEIGRFAAFGGKLYATTWSYSPSRGTEIWSSSTGNSGTWTRVVANGFGDAHNVGAPALEVFGTYLYAGTNSYSSSGSTGGEVWRTNNGTSWSQVNADGFGTNKNTAVSALAAFGGYLYAGTVGASGHGGEVWRCQTCNSSASWTKVLNNGMGNSETRGMCALEVFDGQLYFAVGNRPSGMEVWRTANGTTWQRVGTGGFGTANNWAPYWDASLAVFDNHLYLGTWNPATGGEVRIFLDNVAFAPVVMRK